MMSDTGGSAQSNGSDTETALYAIGAVLLRGRRLILSLSAFGLLIGAAVALLKPRVYQSAATFIPQDGEAGANSALALAASQFGVRIPQMGDGWGPPVYVELLRSKELLEPLAEDTVTVREEGDRRAVVMDLIGIDRDMSPGLRRERAVRKLRKIVRASELKRLGAVRLEVETRWPSVSLAMAEELVRGVNEFNLNSRKTQASAQRQFVQGQARAAEVELREAENRLLEFALRNRGPVQSPTLALEQDRLERQVTLRQQVYNTLMQALEEARIDEVRNTPVITLIESPAPAALPRPRGTIMKGLLGAFLGAIVGVLAAMISHGMARARGASTEEARAFTQLVTEATPKFLRRA